MSVPAILQRPEILAYLAQLLAAGHGWQEGDEAPPAPTTLDRPLPELIALLEDPTNRAYVAKRLSVLTSEPGRANRAERRRRR